MIMFYKVKDVIYEDFYTNVWKISNLKQNIFFENIKYFF